MRLTLALIFFLSGASALVFESLWFRLVGLSLGNSVWSASLVLAAFMGGLALGNALVAKLHSRISRPLRVYAGLEFAIGLGGMVVVLVLPQFPSLLGPALGGLTDTPVLLNAVRLVLAFGFLLIPGGGHGRHTSGAGQSPVPTGTELRCEHRLALRLEHDGRHARRARARKWCLSRYWAYSTVD